MHLVRKGASCRWSPRSLRKSTRRSLRNPGSSTSSLPITSTRIPRPVSARVKPSAYERSWPPVKSATCMADRARRGSSMARSSSIQHPQDGVEHGIQGDGAHRSLVPAALVEEFGKQGRYDLGLHAVGMDLPGTGAVEQRDASYAHAEGE